MADYSTRTDQMQALLTTTLEKVLGSKAVHDNIFNSNPLLSWLRAGDRIKVIDGGEKIRLGIMYAKNSTSGYYADYEALDTTPQEGITTALFNWKQASTSISVSGKEIRSNKGEARISNLQEDKITQASLSLVDLIATGIYSDGCAAGSKQITGLEAMIETVPGTTQFAGVPTSNSAWRNQAQASVGNAAANLVTKLRTVMNDCKQGKGSASSASDAVFMEQASHEAFEAVIQPQVRYAPNPSGGADAGLETIKFRGASVDWDDFCTSGMAYVLNSAHIAFFVHRDANFSMASSGFQRPINGDSLVAQILLQANLATNNRRKLGKLAGLS
jgi:hypothetical protein